MSIRKKRRKKVCPCCGRKLWLRDYYKDRNGNSLPTARSV